MRVWQREGNRGGNMQLSELRKEMRFNMELVSLIDTLKNIASSRYHALERDKERFVV